jgi:HD superfamily phosphohydrolase
MANIVEPVHRSIYVTKEEEGVIEHPAFQRLRRIKQLSSVQLIFPAALHSRFVHSIGVMHVASRICDALLSDSKHILFFRRYLRLAGLLHDIGHGPYSHQFEKFTKSIATNGDLKENLKTPQEWIKGNPDKYYRAKLKHEAMSIGIIKRIFEEMGSDIESQSICCLIDENIKPGPLLEEKLHDHFGNQEQGLKILKSIISSEIDADRIDYLLRDAYFTGVVAGSVDLEHLLNSISLKNDGTGWFISLKQNCVSAVEQLLIGRKAMFDQVYTHPVNALFGDILGQILLEHPGSIVAKDELLNYKSYINLTDEVVFARIQERCGQKEVDNRLCKLFVSGVIPEKVGEAKIVDLEHKSAYISQLTATLKPSTKLHGFDLKPLTGLRSEESVIKVFDPAKNSYEPLADRSSLIKSSYKAKDEALLVVFEDYTSTTIESKVDAALKILGIAA